MRERWSRRQVLVGMLGAGMALLLGACGQDGNSEQSEGEGEGPIAEISPGQGAVVVIDGEDVAVYKAEDGSVIELSPVCPHQQCTVEWDEAERVWACPCHASLFEPDGTVISGPATENLAKLS